MDLSRLALPAACPLVGGPGSFEPCGVLQDSGAGQRALYESLPDGVLVCEPGGAVIFANAAAARLFAADDASRLVGLRIGALLGADGARAFGLARGAGAASVEVECMRLDGTGCVIELSVSATTLDARPARQALLRDATARRGRETIAARTRELLGAMVDGEPLADVLARVCRAIEGMLGGSARCAVMLLDPERRRLLATATGTLPRDVLDVLHGFEVGDGRGACAAAAGRGQRVIVDDVVRDPLCAGSRAIAARHGIRACWASPLRDADGRTAGVLGVFHDTPQRPGPFELELVDAFVRLADEALARIALRDRLRRDRLRHESVLRAVGAAVLVFRGDWRLAHWNAGAQRLLGLDDSTLAACDAQRLLAGAVTEDGSALAVEDSPIDRCVRTRQPQRDRVIGLLRADGRRRWVSVNVQPVEASADDPDDDSVVCSLADITPIKTAHQRLEQLARTDVLTGLPNRLFLQAEAARLVAAAAREGTGLGMLVLDLDGFKHVNDTLGHAAGDALLIDVSQRLEGALAHGSVLARLGGDEFVVLSRDAGDPESLRALGRRLAERLGPPFTVAGQEVFVSAAIGGAVFPLHAATPEALFRCADAAMYRAKRAGRAEVRLFGPELAAPRVNRITVEADLRHALARGELELHYQPRWRTVDGAMAGVEALVRWNHPARGRVPPGEFIPVAEESGLIVPLGLWVLDEACRRLADWRARGVAVPSVAVNVSAAQFSRELFAARIPEALARHRLAPSDVELEITETVLMRPLDDGEADAIAALRARGLKLLLDDFGTGYASLSCIQRFPLDGLKIDRSFVARLPAARDARAIVEAVLGMTRQLGIASIAEGVEDTAQADWLRAAGCTELQGFLFAKPLPPDEVESLLEARSVAGLAAA